MKKLQWCIGQQRCEFDRDELLCVVGPTASQKTELAIRICEQLDGEIIGADSVQIYEGFEIGSGKPTCEERGRAVHHLVGTAKPTAPVDAAIFASRAEEALRDIRARGKVPVVCGGSFLWVRALVHGLAKAPAACEKLRDRLEEERKRYGVQALHERLREVDPETATRVNPNDWVRIQRALEVFELSGRRLSDLHREHAARGVEHKARYVGIHWNPTELEQRMRARAEKWLATGWIEEVQGLLDDGLRNTRPMGSVGYRQVVEYLDGNSTETNLLDSVVRATKIFARRQRTWLRDEKVQWFEPF